MKKILDLIRVDLITMNGGKNNMKMIFVLMFLFSGVLGFLFSPLLGLECPLLMGGFFVPMMFQNEIKYHSEKLYSILPINRRDLVKARFLLTTELYTALFLVFYLLMMLALKLKTYHLIFGNNAEEMDIIRSIVKMSDGAFTELGLFNLLYFTAYSFGLITSAGSLRKYFKNSKSFSGILLIGKKKKADKKEWAFGIFIIFVVVLWLLIVAEIIPAGSVILLILLLFLQLAQAANGFLLGAVMVTIAVFSAIYKYVCTVLEYDEKEL